MASDILIPASGESITSANVAQWHKENGSQVQAGEVLVTFETDKVSSEIEAAQSGQLMILIAEGEEVPIGTVIGTIQDSDAAAAPETSNSGKPEATSAPTPVAPAQPTGAVYDVVVPASGESINTASIAQWHVADGASVSKDQIIASLETDKVSQELGADVSGVIQLLAAEGDDVAIGALIAKITEGGAPAAAEPKAVAAVTPASSPKVEAAAPAPKATQAVAPSPAPVPSSKPDFSIVPSKPEQAGNAIVEPDGRTTRKKMSMLRRKIASQLVNAQQTAAILTTFNECDMGEVMTLRKKLQEEFVAKHGVKLGFMSFFIKAVVQGLKAVPSINATIDGNDVVQNHFFDVSVAIGTEKGLVVPVIRDCDTKSFAEIEKDIIDYAVKAKEGKLDLSDMQGGIFTISNGGVYGSLLSTPILNPPQSGILGMHTIQQRPMAVNGKVEIRPMMYLALSYDHRLVDGKEAVTFLIKVKDCIENPTRLMFEL